MGLCSYSSLSLIHIYIAAALVLGHVEAACGKFGAARGQLLRAGGVPVSYTHLIEGGGRLFACAPTGVGKTISTLFPAAKALGEGKAERIFYLTAKTVTRTAAEGAVALLRESQPGLCFKCVTLTAKDKACPLEERQCTPQHCPRAKGYYDRVNDALYRFLNAHSHFTREAIAAFCEAEALCPFEFTLDLSLFCDCIICDYNYLFDPVVSLKRFFDGTKGGHIKSILLSVRGSSIPSTGEMRFC